jgi:hypothetical protein
MIRSKREYHGFSHLGIAPPFPQEKYFRILPDILPEGLPDFLKILLP